MMLIMIVCACASVLVEAGMRDEEKAAEDAAGNNDVMRVFVPAEDVVAALRCVLPEDLLKWAASYSNDDPRYISNKNKCCDNKM